MMNDTANHISSMKLSIRGIFSFYIIFIFASLYVFVQLPTFSFVDFSFCVLLFQSVAMLCFVGANRLTLLRVYFIFSVMFFCVAPWLQFANKLVVWSPTSFSTSDYVITNFVIFTSNIVVIFAYVFTSRKDWSGRLINKLDTISSPNSEQSCFLPLLLLLLSASSFYLLLFMNKFSFMSIFFRGIVDDQFGPVVDSSSLLMVIDKLVRLVPFFSFLYSYTHAKSRPLLNGTLFVLLLLCAFPTGISRYMVAFIYIPIILSFFPRLTRGFSFSYLLIGSIIFVFPFLNQFRYFTKIDRVSFFPSSEMFLSGHFDAYQNLMQVIQLNLITYGNQLFGVLLFFVPRSIWSNKAIGSGHYLYEVADLAFDNISMPLLGEGYINFGILGVVLFSTLAGAQMGILDKLFERTSSKTELSYTHTIYFYLCGALTFVLRGDLLSSFSYVTAGVVSAVLVLFLANILNAAFPYNKIKLF